MEQKINVAKLLKDCPSGMELDCMMFDDAKFISIEEDDKPICIRTGDIYRYLTKFGTWTFDDNAKCVIFPKGKTTWKGFHRPFNDGDVVSAIINKNLWYGIYKKEFDDVLYCYVSYSTVTKSIYQKSNVCSINSISEMHFATEEEKEKLFKAIKDNGYNWNAETKTLEYLPKFKVGDWVEFKLYERKPAKVRRIENNVYYLSSGNTFMFQDEHAWELTTKKFDITTLKPFDKVLVRDVNTQKWTADLFSFFDKNELWQYSCVGHYTKQCIPYEGNEHLLGTINDCDDYFKNW